MTYRMLTDLADICRKAGLKVVEVDGWKTRGRPSSTGGFDPVGVLAHHTATRASSSDADVLRLLVSGRSDLPGPLCQLGLGRDGTVYVVAAGRANHGGTARASGTVAGGDANNLYIGIEAFNDGVGEKWPAVQYDAYVKLAAVLCREVTGNSAATVRGHKETSVTGKIDPTFDMHTFRERVDALLEDDKPKPPKSPKPRADYTDAHISGLWSEPAAVWSRAIAAVVEEGASLLSMTETTVDGVLRDAIPKGWAFDRLDDKPGQSECAILWNRRVWDDAGQAYPTQLATTRFKTSKGFLRPPVTSITKPLRHKKTGLLLLRSALHAPSSVQGKDGFKGTPARVKAHREAVASVHESWDRGRGLFEKPARALGADWNVDMRQAWVQRWWHDEYPLLKPCWDARLPERGTHGKRVIDWIAASPQLQAVDARVLNSVRGFDHKPLLVRYAVRS